VWTTYTEPGQGRGRGAGAGLPFTEEAKKKVSAYRALVGPTSDTPGGYCLGTGMPGSMLGSGGYDEVRRMLLTCPGPDGAGAEAGERLSHSRLVVGEG
jgi:hypothetical protein